MEKNEINLIFETEKEGNYDIFGEKFVEKNKGNILLNINGNEIDLVNKYKLNKGQNNIKMIIRNKITNLEEMFYKCIKLKNINELKYLKTENCTNFRKMFYKCVLLSDIKPLENWKVSRGLNFKSLYGCSPLKDKTYLKKWKISDEKFNSIFIKYFELNDLNKIKLIKEITKDSFTLTDVDNTFSIFKSINDLLVMIYSNNVKSIIAYNIINNQIINEIKKAHKEIITNIRHYFDSIKKRDLIMSISDNNKNIKIWDFNNWSLLTNIKGQYNKDIYYLACFLKDNNQIYILTSEYLKIGESKPIKIYDLEGTKIKEINNLNDKTFFIDAYFDEKLSKNFIVTGNQGYDISYDYNENKIYHKYIDHPKNNSHYNHYSLIVSSKEEITKLIESDHGGKIRIWDFHSGLLISRIKVDCFGLYSICLFNDNFLFVGCQNKMIKLIDLDNGIIRKTLTEDIKGNIICLKVIDDSYLLSQGLLAEQIKIWKID